MITFAFIFARGGSKGIPGKNIKPLAGKPMLSYAVEMATELDQIQKVFVSTDDKDIAVAAKQMGAEVISRPLELAQDDSPEWQAWQHAVHYVEEKYGNFDVFVSLPVTAPLREKQDVESCIQAFSAEVDMVVSVCESNHNPFFNMVRMDENGYIGLFNQSSEHYSRRQDVPKAYNLTTITYVTRPEYIKCSKGVFDGVVKAIEVPQERAIDIDTPIDFMIAKCLIENPLGD